MTKKMNDDDLAKVTGGTGDPASEWEARRQRHQAESLTNNSGSSGGGVGNLPIDPIGGGGGGNELS